MLQAAESRDQAGLRPVSLPPLSRYRGSLAARVYLSLREAILTLAVRPGEPLRKPDICAALGVSRSPVADAVVRLQAEGLVDVVAKAGTYVARFSMDEIREGAFLREAIELHAVARLAETVTPSQVSALKAALRRQDALVAHGDIAGFYEEDAAMHAQILGFTGFRRLAVVADSAWVHVNRARRLLLPMPGRVAETLEEHRSIVDAIAAGDAPAATEATRHHLGQLLRRLDPLETERPDLFAPAPQARAPRAGRRLAA
jgi:GntR family transcriptional regulator, rspAB operon transcriptional repressor